MKRNGAGLASICILATMVLVMLSSTTCLYFGVEDSINTRYPSDININTSLLETKSLFDESTENIKNEIKAYAAGITQKILTNLNIVMPFLTE